MPLLADLSASGKPTIYPDECVKTYYRPSLDFPYPDEQVKKHQFRT
jgi:hypothetical protein